MLVFSYLLVNLGAISIPFIFSFHPKLQFYRVWKAFFIACISAAIPFLIWDEYFTQWGVWGFNPDYLLGIYVFNLPLEEILFFICIPYACVFTWHCFKQLLFHKWKENKAKVTIYILAGLSIFIGITFYEQLYTRYTAIFLAGLLLVLGYFKVNWFMKFLFCYGVLLIPFTIVNGILTGTGLDSPIVWYNDIHNFGIRLLSIPIEDIFYGMTLILLNVFIFEKILQRDLKIR